MEKEIWMSTQKQGTKTLYVIKTRDAEMANRMLAANELMEALKVAHDMLIQAKGVCTFSMGALRNLTEIIEPAIAKAKGE